MGGCVRYILIILYQISSNDIKSIVEHFHFLDDKKFIDYCETKLVYDIKEGKKVRNYSKINDIINVVSKIIYTIQFDDTIIHYSVYHDRYELTKYLITNGADPNKQNKRKRSALDIANSKNNSKMIAILEGTKN